MDRTRRDNGSIVLGWLTKLVVLLAVLGVLAFDGIAITVNNVTAEDDANTVARAAADAYHTTHDVQAAYNAALEAVPNSRDSLLPRRFSIDPDGTVHLVLRRETRTLVVHHISALRHYEITDADGDATPLPQ